MKSTTGIPAAQYVRMSTEDQRYSIANQAAAIQTYANNRGYVVVSTYADEGKSGVEIKHRNELRRLLSDVMGGRAKFKVILVYDVSRWGRFQDVDEAAHYEFLCRSAAVPVLYCAEQFENDGSLSSSIMKAVKRTMAAEYSRELGVKVLSGQRRLALLGFRVVGPAGYGMQRMMISPDGRRRLILKDGERKAIQTDRTVLVPGPKREVECVRTIFTLAAAGKTPKEIAKELRLRRMLTSKRLPWGRSSVHRILTNEKYAGCNTYGKTTQKLSSVSRVVERHLWIRSPDAFVPLVDQTTFDRVQKLLRQRGAPPERSNDYLIQAMKKTLVREGKLTHRILKKRGILSRSYYKRFGTIMEAYKIAGFTPPYKTLMLSSTQRRLRELREKLYVRLKELFCERVGFITMPGQKGRLVVEIDGRLRIAVYLCRPNINENSWILRLRSQDAHLPVLICTVSKSGSDLRDFYVLPPPDSSMKWKILRVDQNWLSAGQKLRKLDELCNVANETLFQYKNREDNTVVDDIRMSPDCWTVTLGKTEISLGPVVGAIFKMLILNRGQTISRDRLRKAVSDGLDPSSLDANISKLRVKLGIDNRKRIQTVRCVGYRYVSP